MNEACEGEQKVAAQITSRRGVVEEEVRTAQEWAEAIKEQGAAFFHGKVSPNWKINGAKKTGVGYGEYGRVNISGDGVTLAFGANPLVVRATVEVDPRETKQGQDFFQKLRSEIDDSVKETLGEAPGMIAYTFGMPSIPEVGETRPSGGTFGIFLKDNDFQILREQIRENPLLVEEIFQTFYPGLIGSGMKRYQADRLGIVDVAEGEGRNFQGKSGYSSEVESFFRDKVNFLEFPKPVGEVSA